MKAQKLCRMFFFIMGLLLILFGQPEKGFAGGELGDWTETTPLPRAVYGHQSFTANGYIYCVGGADSNNFLADIWYAKVNEDGSIGTWQTTSGLPKAVIYHQCFIAYGYVYCAGGFSSDFLSDVWYAKIYTDGTIGTWQSTTSLPKKNVNHQCFVINGYVYCVGGSTSWNIINDSSSDVWYAKINENGTISAWQATTSLPKAINDHSCFTANGYVYCAGGFSSSSTMSDVWHAKINTDGTLGIWLSTISLPKVTGNHQCFTTNGYIYCAGGSGVYLYSNVWYAKLNTDGTTEMWQSTTSMPKETCSHQCLSIGSFSYCLGGEGNGGKVYVAPIAPITLLSHPDASLAYYADSLNFVLTLQKHYGCYYLIDDISTTVVTLANSQYSMESTISDTAITNGTHYLHVAIADSNYFPGNTLHYVFNNCSTPVTISSSTHLKQEEWYSLSNVQITITPNLPGISFRYCIDDQPGMIPDASSPLKSSSTFVLPNQTAGTHYLHIRPFNAAGELAPASLTSHFRFNINGNSTKPSPLPSVTNLKVTPSEVPKNGAISIEATISLPQTQ